MAFGDEGVASLPAQVDVEEDEVDVLPGHRLPSRGERAGLEDLVTVELEVDPAEQPNRRLIVDDEDPSRRRMPPGIAHRAESSGRQ